MTTQPAGPATGPAPLEGGNLGTLVAYDPVKQEIRWRVPVGNSRYGGTLSTATIWYPGGAQRTLDRLLGRQRRSALRPGYGMRNGMGPPITFTVDGKQYIALMGGSAGRASPGVSAEVTTKMKPRLLVFGLDGKAELPKQEPTPAPAFGGSTPAVGRGVPASMCVVGRAFA